MKVKYLTEDALQKHSEFEAGMIIGSLGINPARKPRTVWSAYNGDLLEIHGKIVRYLIECRDDVMVIVYMNNPTDFEFDTRGAVNDSIVAYRPIELPKPSLKKS